MSHHNLPPSMLAAELFYIYRQNNSGGRFGPPAVTVLVEAVSPTVADALATSHCKIYFDGVGLGLDCECCGDRWTEAEHHYGK